MQKVLVLFLIVCAILIGGVSAADVNASASENATVTVAETTSAGLIGGDMGTYLVKANVDDANVTFDNDFKGSIVNGTLNVDVYTTATPYKVITVEKSGYEIYTANITEYPAKNETVEVNVVLVPVAAQNTTAAVNETVSDAGANVTAPAEVTSPAAETTAVPATTKAGSLPFAVFGAFVVLGIVALRTRR
ncbi:MAG: hypothetical protein WC342_10045 [Methanoregula sp.]